MEDGLRTAEGAELITARRRIPSLETELAIHLCSAELLKEKNDPKAGSAAIHVMVAEDLPVTRPKRVITGRKVLPRGKF